MPTRAKVTSVDALETFRASLVIYLSKARPTVDEVSSDVVRVRMWLENEQRVHWESQVRRRSRNLQEAEQAVFSARLSSLRETTAAELMAVTKAKRALEQAEGKLQVLKKWNREFSSQVEPLARQLERLQSVLVHDLPQAAVYLGNTVKTLNDYTGLAAPSISPAESGSSRASETDSTLEEQSPVAVAPAIPTDNSQPDLSVESIPAEENKPSIDEERNP